MGLNVFVHETGTHLSVRAAGQYSLADFSQLFDRVGEISREFANKALIVDVTGVDGFIRTMDMHALGEYCAKVWTLPLRIAIVSPEGGLNKFFENVARNRGVHVVVVSNHAAAVEWVLMER